MHPAEVVAAAVARLRDAGIPTETRVATLRAAFGRTKLRPVGTVWRLGAVCVDADGGIWATGDVLVVSAPTHPNFRSQVALERNETRRMLVRAGVAVGTTVVLDPRPLDPDAPAAPLVALDDGVGVQWIAGGQAVPLAAYLDERVELLIHPPARATD